MSTVYNDQDNKFDNKKLTKLDRITVNRDPSSYSELANKKCNDHSLAEASISSFSQTKENYLKVSVGNTTYKPTRCDRIQTTEATKHEI